MKARRRHEIIWRCINPACRAAAKLIFRYSGDICREEGPLLIMANHNADLDPLLIAYSFPRAVYFVASEHILRGKAGKFLRWATDIIPRQKGGSASTTVRGILRHAQEGHDVCIFPEGNRSWDGVTRSVTLSTGKLARTCGAKLVTYRTEGMYFSSPRWAGGSLRRGKAHGTIVGIYEPQYLKTLSTEQVQAIIDRDLHENAYERQRKKAIPFRGKRLAEHLETLLFTCPHCKAEGKMRSEDDMFVCDECGTRLRYTPEGFFVGENCIFDSVLDWRVWQDRRVREKCLAVGENEPVFSDADMELYNVDTGAGRRLAAVGTVTLYKDRLVLPDGTEIKTGCIKGMSVLGPQDLYFSSQGKNYLMRSNFIRCVSKYLTACSVFDNGLRYGI